jgi:UDPglucose 6-dehydrogenase
MHAVALITEWDAYRALDLKKLHAAMAGDVLVDLRNIYRPEDTAAAGFKYVSVGR